MLRESLLWLAEAPLVDVEMLRALTGVWLWAALLCRPLLSVPSAIFTLMEKCPYRVVPWWPQARKEVWTMARLVPAMEADVGRPVSP